MLLLTGGGGREEQAQMGGGGQTVGQLGDFGDGSGAFFINGEGADVGEEDNDPTTKRHAQAERGLAREWSNVSRRFHPAYIVSVA
jgi:hypothetical protein